MSHRKFAPKVFISYSHENSKHTDWVTNLSLRLRDDGVDLIFDKWEVKAGDSIPDFINLSIDRSNFTIIVCTPKYRVKCEEKIGGVKYEESVITNLIYYGAPRSRFIPLLRKGNWNEVSPSWLRGSRYLDFRQTSVFDDSYLELIETLHGRREGPPPIGVSPFFNRPGATSSAPVSTNKAITIVRPKLDISGTSSVAYDDLSWPSTWATAASRLPNDPLLFEQAREWLERNPDSPEWSTVWSVLTEWRPGDPALIELARIWTSKRRPGI